MRLTTFDRWASTFGEVVSAPEINPEGTREKGRFEPAHALFMAYGALCENREELQPGSPLCAAWLRGEAIPAHTARAGWAAVTVAGLPLGFGKASGGMVKNRYPKGLRNLG